MKTNIQLLLLSLLLLIVGCKSYPTNAPVHDAYLGDTTTFEGNASLQFDNYDSAKALVKDVLMSNGFKLVSEDDRNKQMVARREVKGGFVTTAVYFYSTPSTTNLRLVTQVPRNGTAYYRIHEQIMVELK